MPTMTLQIFEQVRYSASDWLQHEQILRVMQDAMIAVMHAASDAGK
jgi:hypothetical protein